MTRKILITGATDGIGLLTARKLAAAGHQVLIHGRSQAKLSAAADEIGTVETYLADFSRLGEVAAMARTIRDQHDRLDVVINNAGVLKSATARTESGRDIRFEVNTLAPYLLTRSLLPIIPPEGRIVNLSSAAQARVDVASMTDYRPMDDMSAYAQSKLALTIWSAEMAGEHPDGPVIVAVNPGSLLASKMVREGFGLHGNDLNVGADILIRAAVSDEFKEASGQYFDNDSGAFAAPDAAALDATHTAEVMAAITSILDTTP
ncbi:MAG: SDR family NAD(P)-dependent oxidoreductase [Pseudomonadota bacterium]